MNWINAIRLHRIGKKLETLTAEIMKIQRDEIDNPKFSEIAFNHVSESVDMLISAIKRINDVVMARGVKR